MKRYTSSDISFGNVKTTVIHLTLPVRIVNYAKQLAKKEDYELRNVLRALKGTPYEIDDCDYKHFLQDYLFTGFAMEQARVKRAKAKKAKASAKAASAGKRILKKPCRRVTL